MSASVSLTACGTQNHKAQLVNAYNELGKELSSSKIRVIGNYTLGKAIGEGAYGKVRLGTHRLTSIRVAIKQVPKAMSASLTREIHHHRQLHHPHIMQMYEVIATESSIWIVTELCSGGELFDYLVEKGRLEEDEARVLIGQLCLAVAYLHDRNIVHRDLKLENVLLDERCRVKLGDFGFTREFERGSLMETFCGTTGYAAPEMLQGKRYMGPEVDVWSLGVILYTLLTGSLPFDDDDDAVMRDKIIHTDLEIPQWLSPASRDLIKNILQKDPANRLTIAQILSHSWFTRPRPLPASTGSTPVSPCTPSPPLSPSATPPTKVSKGTRRSSVASNISEISFQSVSSNAFVLNSPITTPDKSAVGGQVLDSPATVRFPSHPAEHDPAEVAVQSNDQHPSTVSGSCSRADASATKAPTSLYPFRTPARTKRRSISSVLSDDDTGSPSREVMARANVPQDFSSLLNTPAPIIFSTPLERELLNNLSNLGFDTAQIVHSVLSHACDCTGAIWWMLRRKAEKKISGPEPNLESTNVGESPRDQTASKKERSKHPNEATTKRNAGVQTADTYANDSLLASAQSAPQLAFFPPTPTALFPPATTSALQASSDFKPILLPSPESVIRLQPSTAGASSKDSHNGKVRKPRAGSVSIMQRAATALEAAGIVRKKSTEGVSDEKEHERSKEIDRKNSAGEDLLRHSHGSSPSKLTKSPPSRSLKDHGSPTTSESTPEIHHPQPLMAPQWSLTGPRNSSTPPPRDVPSRSMSSPDDTVSALPTFNKARKDTGTPRNRASLLTAFRWWFNEDRKGKRKEAVIPMSRGQSAPAVPAAGTSKRRTSGNPPASSRKKNRVNRHSVSSHRSSSVNSRRSSGTSAQLLAMESPLAAYDQSAWPSLGNHTPSSDRDHSSRPSSIHSVSLTARHRRSPSAGSTNSTQLRTTSPIQKVHRRGNSATSTMVVRQARRPHVRSNSTTSSVHSLPSSRPTSFYGETSDPEGTRSSSPFRPPSSRRSRDETPRKASGNSQFVAQKRQTPFLSPAGYSYNASVGRTSWKKSWGLEPPGWQSRTAHPPIEVLVISPPDGPSGIRDVYSGRASLSIGDESDWVDEEDDGLPFAGGLGQTPTSASGPSSSKSNVSPRGPDSPVQLCAPPRALHTGRRAKRAGSRSSSGSDSGSGGTTSPAHSRQKVGGHSTAGRASPIPGEIKHEAMGERTGGRRQLPAGRSGPAFRGHAIQEEDEEEI